VAKTFIRNLQTFKYEIYLSIIIFFAISFRVLIPQNPLPELVHDDYLMVELANSISSGEWLGIWNSTSHPGLTLYKPPGYPIFLALCMKIGIAPAVATLLIYLFSVLFIVKYGLNIALKSKLGIFAFTLFAFNPAFYGNESSRIYRDILIAATLTVLLAISFFVIQTNSLSIKIVYLGGINGVAIGFSALLRDDIKYLGLMILLITTLAIYLKHYKVNESRYRKKIYSLLFLGISLFGYFIVTNAIKIVNYNKYGVYLIQDNTSGAFSKMFMNLSSIESTKNVPDVHINESMIINATKGSTKFSELYPYLATNNLWKELMCVNYKFCEPGSHFYTAEEIRDAMYVQKLMNTPIEFQNNAKIIDTQFTKACDSKTILCNSSIKIPGIGNRYSEISEKFALDSVFKLQRMLINWEYVTFSTPRNLELKNHEKWKGISGIKWNYKTHPVSGTSLGLNEARSFQIWIYKLMIVIVLIITFMLFRFYRFKINQIFYDRNLLIVCSIYAAGSVLMVLSHITGWLSLHSPSSYLLYFSSLIIYFYVHIIKFSPESQSQKVI
jgi:hypothetical protein